MANAESGEGIEKGGDTFPTTAFSMQLPEGKHLLSTPDPYLEHPTSSKLLRLGYTAVRRACGAPFRSDGLRIGIVLVSSIKYDKIARARGTIRCD